MADSSNPQPGLAVVLLYVVVGCARCCCGSLYRTWRGDCYLIHIILWLLPEENLRLGAPRQNLSTPQSQTHILVCNLCLDRRLGTGYASFIFQLNSLRVDARRDMVVGRAVQPIEGRDASACLDRDLCHSEISACCLHQLLLYYYARHCYYLILCYLFSSLLNGYMADALFNASRNAA